MNRTKVGGVYLVEFTIVAVFCFFIILFGVLEVGRLLFTVNVLNESVRRGARLAVVCNIDDPVVLQRAIFASAGGVTSNVVGNLESGSLSLKYLDSAGESADSFEQIRFVEVSIEGFRFQFIVPMLGGGITLQPFRAVLPRESLGRTPESSEITPC